MQPRRHDHEAPHHGLFLVRTTETWEVTFSHADDPVPVPFAVVLGLVHASGGGDLQVLDPTVGALRDAGALVPAALAGEKIHADPSPWSTRTGAAEHAPMRLDAWIWPPVAVLGRIVAGALLIEGRDGQQLLLDEVDLALLDAMDDANGALVSTIVETVRRRGSCGPVGVDELCRRVARLESLGRVRWYPETLTLQGEEASPLEPDPVEPARPDAAVAASEPATPKALAGTRADLRRLVAQLSERSSTGRRLVSAVRRLRAPAAVMVPDAPTPVAIPEPVEPIEPIEPIELTPSSESEVAAATDSRLYRSSPRMDAFREGRVPVYSPFQLEYGPVLSLSMLTASARHHDGGRLNEVYEIRRTEDPDSFLLDLTARQGPAIVLCSNYLWSFAHNLELAERALKINPELVFIHGGPHTPKYAPDCRAFFEAHPATVHVTVRSEGEVTLVDVLSNLAEGFPGIDLERLREVPGISFRDPTDGSMATTPDRDRIADLDSLPSPYLTGEFDHLDPTAFRSYVIFESNRGCPYGCTFCDWGSMTLSRIRMFDLDRVRDEMRWAGERGIRAWVLADANLGIMSRDVDLIESMALVKTEYGVPTDIGFNVAKNTTKHLTVIVDRLVGVGINPHVSLALQTNDGDTLEAIKRTNIHADHYVGLGASFRRKGLPLQADLMLGLPGQSVASIRADMQFLMEHEISARIWITQMLPNSPMNDPEYRAEFAIETDADGMVVSTSTFTAEERAEMKRLRHAHAVFDRYGLLRHVMRFLQWDHDIPMTDVMAKAIAVSRADPDRYPLLNWLLRYFDIFGVPPLGWSSFYDEVRRFILDELDVPESPMLETVLRVQRFLMPEIGRRFPDTVALDHDYLAYHRLATASLWTDGKYRRPERRLADFGPSRFTVYGDPLDRCGLGMAVYRGSRNDRVTDRFWMSGHMELDSSLVQAYSDVAGGGRFLGWIEQQRHAEATLPEPTDDEDRHSAATGVRVRLGRSGGPTAIEG